MLCQTIMNLVLDHMTIRIVPKEKAIGFGCKTAIACYRSLIQEKNTMRYLANFSDKQAQAISLSEMELFNKIYEL